MSGTQSDSAVGDLRVAVIGAGMSGILCGVKLPEAGIDDVVIYEKADRVGGTWRENTYPGLSCDIPSHLYSYSFELNPEWSRTFAPGPEIQDYFERVTKEYDVDRLIRFGEEVTTAEHRDGRWHLTTSTGRTDTVDVVIAATGVLHKPRMPDIEGLDTFEGASFHSARWDHDAVLDAKRVGVIGTGSTAAQITSAVVGRVESFHLFQRTAQWIFQLPNPEYSDQEKTHFRDHPDDLAALHDSLSAGITENISGAVIDAESPQMHAIEEGCRLNLEMNVHDPELRELLRPDYRAACKRLIISPDFYDAIQHPNANLVTAGIERIEPAGVRTTDGVLHELDVLVLATGFHTDAFMRPMEITGTDGVRLDDVWAQRPMAYMSMAIPGFPNLFMLNGPNAPVGNFSLIQVSELQLGYVMKLLDRIRTGECTQLTPTAQALATFDEERTEAAKGTIWYTGCRSWYLDDRGIPAGWPWSWERFSDEMEHPDLGAYELA